MNSNSLAPIKKELAAHRLRNTVLIRGNMLEGDDKRGSDWTLLDKVSISSTFLRTKNLVSAAFSMYM